METQLIEWLWAHWLWLCGFGLIGVYILVFAHGFSGRKEILTAGTKQFIGVLMLAIGTPVVLWLLQ